MVLAILGNGNRSYIMGQVLVTGALTVVDG